MRLDGPVPLLAGVLGLLLAGVAYRQLRARPTGGAALTDVADQIRAGALRFLEREFVVLAPFAVVVAAALATWLAAQRPHPAGGLPADALRVVIVVALAWTAAGCITGFVALVLAQSGDGTVDLGVLATVRTGVLAAATLLIAWGAHRDRLREWAWLVYPLLVLIGLKMVAQDFKHSRPATLFIALALYGIALILAPRLRRARDRSTLTGGTGHAPA